MSDFDYQQQPDQGPNISVDTTDHSAPEEQPSLLSRVWDGAVGGAEAGTMALPGAGTVMGGLAGGAVSLFKGLWDDSNAAQGQIGDAQSAAAAPKDSTFQAEYDKTAASIQKQDDQAQYAQNKVDSAAAAAKSADTTQMKEDGRKLRQQKWIQQNPGAKPPALSEFDQ